MRGLTAVLVVLSVAITANAGLTISGMGGPGWMNPGYTTTISIWSDGLTTSGDSFILMIDGPGTLDISGATNSVNSNAGGSTVFFIDYPGPYFGQVFMDLSIIAIPIPNLPIGKLVDNIILHCDGHVDLTLYGADTETTFDSRAFGTLVPEPMTLGLLGLGGLFLRRRK